MKLRIQFSDPNNGIDEAIERAVDASHDSDDPEDVRSHNRNAPKRIDAALCKFLGGKDRDVIAVEFDTEAGTARVLLSSEVK